MEVWSIPGLAVQHREHAGTSWGGRVPRAAGRGCPKEGAQSSGLAATLGSFCANKAGAGSGVWPPPHSGS